MFLFSSSPSVNQVLCPISIASRSRTAPSMPAGCLLDLVFKDLNHFCQQAVYMALRQGLGLASVSRLSTQPHVKDSASSLLPGCLLSLGSRTLPCRCQQAAHVTLSSRTLPHLPAGCLLGLMYRILPRLYRHDVYSALCHWLCLVSTGRLPTWPHVKDCFIGLVFKASVNRLSTYASCPMTLPRLCWQAVYVVSCSKP